MVTLLSIVRITFSCLTIELLVWVDRAEPGFARLAGRSSLLDA
jgi:hypothetical protein